MDNRKSGDSRKVISSVPDFIFKFRCAPVYLGEGGSYAKGI